MLQSYQLFSSELKVKSTLKPQLHHQAPLGPVNVSASSHGIQLLVGEVPEVMPGSGWEVKQVATSLVPLRGLGFSGSNQPGPRTLEATKGFAKALQLVVGEANLARAHPVNSSVVEIPKLCWAITLLTQHFGLPQSQLLLNLPKILTQSSQRSADE